MQQPKSKFWIVSSLPSSMSNFDTQSIRQQISDVNWVNIAKIKENASILCFRFSVQISHSEVCERLSGIFKNEDFDLENNLHIAETVHTTAEQKNIYVCHLPKFLHDEAKLRMLVNSFVKKVVVIDNIEYMTIRCQSCQNSSLAATFLRSIPAECLIDDEKNNTTSADSHRICFGRKLTVELSISQLPIALVFKVNKDIMDYDNGIPILNEIRKEGKVSKDFIVTKSHITSPCMQVLAITASSLSEIEYIIEKLSDAGFNTKRCLSVPRQEEIEKYEIVIENVQQKTIHELRKRISEEFNASIYEARIIPANNNASPVDSNTVDRNDALIIFYDPEDANKVVQRLQNGEEYARFYRTTALLHNLPLDITSDEVKNYIAQLTLKKENAEFVSQIDNIEVFIHRYSFNKIQIKQHGSNGSNINFEGGSYAEVKFPSIEYMQRFVKFCNLYENQNSEKIENMPPLRGVFIPFVSETRRGRYKREVFYEKSSNAIVKENTIRVFGCTTNEALAIITKGGFPILYFGRMEDENGQPKLCNFSKKTPDVSARMKALMALSGASKIEGKSSVPITNDNNKISIVFNNNRHNSSNNTNNNFNDNSEGSLPLPEFLITFCSKEDMRKAACEFKSKEFNCEEFDFSVLQGNTSSNNDDENQSNSTNNNNNNKNCLLKKLVNPFVVERDDAMIFINEPAPQQQQQKTIQRPIMTSVHSNQPPMRNMQRTSQPSSKFNKKESHSRQNQSLFIKKTNPTPVSYMPPKIPKNSSDS